MRSVRTNTHTAQRCCGLFTSNLFTFLVATQALAYTHTQKRVSKVDECARVSARTPADARTQMYSTIIATCTERIPTAREFNFSMYVCVCVCVPKTCAHHRRSFRTDG